jgi:hypothetical protein
LTSEELTCRQFVELVTDYLEGALGEPAAGLVSGHLRLCEGCVTYLDQMNAVVAALVQLPPEPPPVKLEHAITAALSARQAVIVRARWPRAFRRHRIEC